MCRMTFEGKGRDSPELIKKIVKVGDEVGRVWA